MQFIYDDTFYKRIKNEPASKAERTNLCVLKKIFK